MLLCSHRPHRKYFSQAENGGGASPFQSPHEASLDSASDSEALAQALSIWLSLPTIREQRRYLESPGELLNPDSDVVLNNLLAQKTGQREQVQRIHEALMLLQDVRSHGETGTRMERAIREAYVNAHGGFALDIPPWLEEVEQRLATLLKPIEEQLEQTAAAKIMLLQDALNQAKDETALAPEILAEIRRELASAWSKRLRTTPAQAFEAAQSLCDEVLEVYTAFRYPRQYALMQYLRGNVYTGYIDRERRENLEQAIACYREALRVLTLESYPYDYASIQRKLGGAYEQRIKDEQRKNLEQALICYHEALRVHTFEAFPYDYALIQCALGIVYHQRIVGERRENLEHTIACYREALRVLTLEAYPYEYARAQVNLGIAYQHRITGERRENQEQALACFNEAQQVMTLDAYPYAYAAAQLNLGDVYCERLAGERRENLEQALACFEEALRLFNLDQFPYEYAITQNNVANTYRQRIAGERQENLERAVACYRETLQVFALETFPTEFRNAQLDIAETEAQRNNWTGVHDAYTFSLAAEDVLVALGAGVVGQDAILKEGRNAAVGDGFALTRLGRIEEAVVSIEHGRTRSLAQAFAIDAAAPERITDDGRRARYTATRQSFITAQTALHEPLPPELAEDEQRRRDLERTAAYHEAKAAFDAIVAEVRSAQDPADFLNAPLEPVTILRAALQSGPGHALVYLAAAPWGGVAVGAFAAQPNRAIPAHFAYHDLPGLTEEMVNSLVETRLGGETERVIGGFDCAQRGEALELLKRWPGTTLREKIAALHASCDEANEMGSLDRVAQAVLAFPDLAQLVDLPLETLDADKRGLLACTLNHELLQVELERCSPLLAEAALRPLLAWLHEEQVQSLTLIPCGALAAFPLLSIAFDGEDRKTLGEVVQASIAPSARSLLREKDTSRNRTGVYALGNPYPTDQSLEWGEAEAETIAVLGEQLGIAGRADVQWDATRAALIDALQTRCVVDASCHGRFDTRDFLNACLLLAGGESLTLADMLNRKADLRGLRLLILSACQTAILDLRGARDEVRSLAVGTLQAGAEAVLAALWPVDDEATYLLMVRFAQLWLAKMNLESPASALAQAQHWLRTVTNQELQDWRAQLPAAAVKISEPTMKGSSRLIAVRGGRGSRFDTEQAEKEMQKQASRSDPAACPFAAPYYWAGFQITGW
jgi:CHAT domain-containing protein